MQARRGTSKQCTPTPPEQPRACPLQVRKGMLVWDPFVGTGSILVAAAHLGAQTFGTDIDIRVIKWGESSREDLSCNSNLSALETRRAS